jgi:hypothetical protein
LKECYIWKIPLKDERLLLRKIPLKGWTVTRKYHSVTFVVHAINHIPFSLLRRQAHANSSPSPCSGNRHTWTGVVQEKLAAPDHWRRCGHSSYRRCSRRGRRAGGRGRRWAVEVVTRGGDAGRRLDHLAQVQRWRLHDARAAGLDPAPPRSGERTHLRADGGSSVQRGCVGAVLHALLLLDLSGLKPGRGRAAATSLPYNSPWSSGRAAAPFVWTAPPSVRCC